MLAFWKVASLYTELCLHQCLVRSHFWLITASMRCGMDLPRCWRSCFYTKLQLSTSWIYFLQLSPASDTTVIKEGFGTFGSMGRCHVQLERITQHLHKTRKQSLEWSSTQSVLVDGCVCFGLDKTLITSVPNDWENFTLDVMQIEFCFYSFYNSWELDFLMKSRIKFYLRRRF